MSFQSHIVHVVIMHIRFVYEAHKQILTSCMHQFSKIIKGLVTVYRYYTLAVETFLRSADRD